MSSGWQEAPAQQPPERVAPQRLQRRIAVSIAFAVLVTLILSGVALVLSKRSSLVRTMESSAMTYTRLLSLPVTRLAVLYRTSGHEKLHQKMAELMELNRSVERIEVVDVLGRVALETDRQGVRAYPPGPDAPTVQEPGLMDAIRGLQPTAGHIRSQTREELFRVVAPAVEEWGRHTYSVVATFSYATVNREILRTALSTVAFLVVGLAIAYWSSIPLARSMSQNLELLHNAVSRISRGHFSERVEIRSGDEIEDLATAFNAMAEELEKTIVELQDAYRELLSLEQAKDDLIANVSHELKTPLTALRGYLELLAENQLGELTPDASRAVEVCQRNLRRLGARIEEMMMVARTERGLADQTMERLALGQLLNGVVETLLPRIESEGLFCTLNVPQEGSFVVGSVEHLERVFSNLLDNSIKFTPPGGQIRISVASEPRRGEPGVVVRVADTGQGIPEDELNRIFDRFYQVDPSSSRRHGGMGLGLSLVRTVVESHGGHVWAESEIGHGTTFFVWLPEKERSPSGNNRPVSADEIDG